MLHCKEQSGVCGCVKSRVPVSSSEYQTGLQLVVAASTWSPVLRGSGVGVRSEARQASVVQQTCYRMVTPGTPLVSPLFGINHGDQYDKLPATQSLSLIHDNMKC